SGVGRSCGVFSDADHSQFLVEDGSRSGEDHRAVVGFHGTVEIDTETGDVLHFDYTADGIPTTVELTRSATSRDFDSGRYRRQALYPSGSVGDGTRRPEVRDQECNRVPAFRKFDSSSTVEFGAGK